MSKHFYITQSQNEINVQANLIKKLYNLVCKHEMTGEEYDNTTNLIGNIQLASPIYKECADKVAGRNGAFQELNIDSLFYMLFQDSNVKSIMIAYLLSQGIGDGIGITYDDAKDKKIISLPDFKNNTDIEYFNELQYFERINTLSSQAFSGCTNLKEIDLSNITTYNNDYHFANCTNLQKATLSPNLTTISRGCFTRCTSLDTVENTINIINVSQDAFSNNKSLENIDLENCKIINGSSFYGCTLLKDVNMINIETIGHEAFRSCSNLKITYPLSKCTTINGSNIFTYCISLTEIDLPICTYLGTRAFYECTGLTSINIPNITNIPECLCYKCTSLTTVTGDNITSIDNSAFENCSHLTNINLSKCTTINKSAFRNTGITSLELPLCTSIGSDSFRNCSTLSSISLPLCETVGQYAFTSDSVLSSIDLSSCTTIDSYVFNECSSLTTVNLQQVQNVNGYRLFSGCKLLTNITGLTNIVNVSTDHFMFENCEKLVFPSTITINSTYVGYRAFYNCKLLQKVVLGTNVKSLYNSVFEGCTSLTSIEGLSNITKIGAYMFYNCINLEGIIDLSNVTEYVTGKYDNISQGGEDGMFYNCNKISKIIIGHIDTIGTNAFVYNKAMFIKCTNLHTVEINSVNNIKLTSNIMFSECNNFRNLVIRSSTVPNLEMQYAPNNLSWNNITNNNDAYMYVLDSLLETYRTTEGYSNFADHILPISQYVPISD